MSSSQWSSFTAWLKFGSAVREINMGTLPGPCFVLPPFVSVPTDFDSGSSDTLEVGHEDDPNAFGTAFDLQSVTGYSVMSSGVEIGYRSSGKDVILTYTPSGSAASQGLAIVVVPFLRLPFPP